MYIPEVIHNGVTLSMFTPDQLSAAGVPASVIDEHVSKAAALQARDVIRSRITATAGDIPSLLGTTADVAALGLLGAMQLLIVIAENGTAEMKAALAASPIPMPVDKAKKLLAAIKKGDVKVPALIKGIDKVYAEVAARSTATAIALETPKA